MQTTYAMNVDLAVEGQAVGERKSRPGCLPWTAQVNTITIANSEAGSLVITVVDDETQQTYTLTVTISGAVEATSLDEMVAAWRASGELNNLFSVVEDGATVMTLTARHANREYTITTTPPGSMTAVVAEPTAAGGTGLEFGRFVAKGSNDGEIAALGATSELVNLFGVLFRTDGNHFHSLENDTPSAVDRSDVGRSYACMTEGRFMARVEEAVTPASTPYLRRALTSSAGRLGGLRASPAGSAQVNTIVPVVDHMQYGFQLVMRINNRLETFNAQYTATDATTTVADAIDGLYDSIVEQLGDASSANNGKGVSVTESDTALTLTTDAGVEVYALENTVWDLDTEVATSVATIGTADVDAIDISDICEFETSAAQDGYARVRVKM